MTGIQKSEALHLQSYRVMKQHILNDVYQAGSRITELGLSKELGVSRGTIREAVKMLLQDGLFVQTGGQITVFEPTLENAIHLYLCRERLESLAAKLAASQITNEQKQQLHKVLQATKQALKQNNRTEMSALNTQFHDMIIRFAKNHELEKIMSNISSKIICVRNSVHKNYVRTDDFLLEHEAIASAIITGNETEAETLMAKHIENDLQAIRQGFKQTFD